jgi:hypothetical protein
MLRVPATAAANSERLFAIEEQQGRPDKPQKPAREYILNNGRQATKKEGKKCYLPNCQQHDGLNHFPRDHVPNQRGNGQKGRTDQQADGQGAGNGQGGSRE